MMMIFPRIFSMLLLGLSGCVSPDQEQPILRPAKTNAEVVSFDHARQLLERGKNAEAITAFRTLSRQDGASIPVLNGLAIAHAELGRPDLATGLFAEALAISPNDPGTLNNIGFAALRRNEAELAHRYLKRAEQHGDNVPEISGNLALLNRLERRTGVLATRSAHPSTASVDKTFKLQRETASTVRLSSIGTASDRYATHHTPVPLPSSATLIDFSELFDPWSAADPKDDPSL